jgi:hypothetical protein
MLYGREIFLTDSVNVVLFSLLCLYMYLILDVMLSGYFEISCYIL